MNLKDELKSLPPIPDKRYFTIGEAAQLCGVKPHVLRYWEQEFKQLKPSKRRGNRRYYRHQDVVLIRQIRDLLYIQGYTIDGARLKLVDEQNTVIEKPQVQSKTDLTEVVHELEELQELLDA